MKPLFLVILALVAWWIFDLPKALTNRFWPNAAAPWETVDAFYYPDRNDLTAHEETFGFATVEQCRDWVYQRAAKRNDPHLSRGDYECGIEQVDDFGGLRVYRTTVK